MPERSGKELESLTEEMFKVLTSGDHAHVERNVKLAGPDGDRQIDVAVRATIGPIDVLTIIECKDYTRKVTVPVVDAFHSVMADVNASKGIIVTRGGFSNGARHKAKRLGIDLFLVGQASELSAAIREVPIHVREVRISSVGVLWEQKETITIPKGTASPLSVEQLADALRSDLIENPATLERPEGRYHYEVPTSGGDVGLVDVQGVKHPVDWVNMDYVLKFVHFFGYLSELQTASVLADADGSSLNVVLRAEEFGADYEKAFSQFEHPDEFPVEPEVLVSLIRLPDRMELHPDGPIKLEPGDPLPDPKSIL